MLGNRLRTSYLPVPIVLCIISRLKLDFILASQVSCQVELGSVPRQGTTDTAPHSLILQLPGYIRDILNVKVLIVYACMCIIRF